MSKTQTIGLRTWIEADRGAIAANVKTFRSLLKPKTKLMAVVKSNAYGHGLVDFAKAANVSVDWFGVDSLVEGIALRKAGIKKPILVLGYTLPSLFPAAARTNVSLSVSSMEQLKRLVRSDVSAKISVHIKVDTGMHRQGFLHSEMSAVVSFLKRNRKKLKVEGLFTHFAAAKNPAFPAQTKAQLGEFQQWKLAFRDAGLDVLAHAAASGGTLLFPETHEDMVRVGAGLYGIWPAKEVEAHSRDAVSLKPILTWKTIVSETKRLPKGAKIGYDLTETLHRDSVIGICPIGYWHGFPRALSGVGSVLVRGVRCRVLGRVSMDMIVVDLTDVKVVRIGDEAVIIGASGKETIAAEGLAGLSDTSAYEILTRINPLIRRIYR